MRFVILIGLLTVADSINHTYFVEGVVDKLGVIYAIIATIAIVMDIVDFVVDFMKKGE